MASTASEDEHRSAKKEQELQREKEEEVQSEQVPGESTSFPKIQQQPTGPTTITEHIMPSPRPVLRARQTKNSAQLLDLPHELRLEIWRHTVIDPSTDDLVVHITPALVPSSPTEDPLSSSPCSPAPQSRRFQRTFETALSKPRNRPVNIAILRSNQRVYEEALPLLYHSIKFHPSPAALPPFLATLSDFAKAHVTHIKPGLRTVRLKPLRQVSCLQARPRGALR